MAEETRTKRSSKKPAWMNDEMLIDPAEVEADVKVPRPPARKPHAEAAQRVMAAHHEAMMQRPCRPSGRMCSNPQCKNPFDSPQWRRGPLGPGTLCNACGTRYARLQAKMNGDKKGKMRPQERAEWEAFEQQRLHPQVSQQQTWRLQMQHFVQREQQQQQYFAHEQDDFAGYEDSDYGYDERSYSSQQMATHRRQQHYGDAEYADREEDGQLLCQEGLSDSPDIASRAAAAAAAGGVAAGSRPSSRAIWRGSRQHIPNADAATDSQEDEAGAYSCQDVPAGADGAAGGSPAAPSFLHLLAVGEAMIKTEGVAPQERRAAWAEVVERRLGPEPDKAPTRPAGGEMVQGVKRSRFALEAEEQQTGRSVPAAEPTALQRALERFGQQPVPKRAKPGTAGEPAVVTDRFERLLAEAEECIRARSVSPCMLKGVPGPGASPTCNMPAPRPITPLQLGVNAMDAASARAVLPRSLLGLEVPMQHDTQQGMAAFMLPATAMPGNVLSTAAAPGGRGRGRHSNLAQALAAAAAAEAYSADEDTDVTGSAQQHTLNGQFGAEAADPASKFADAVQAPCAGDDAGGGAAADSFAEAGGADAKYPAADLEPAPGSHAFAPAHDKAAPQHAQDDMQVLEGLTGQAPSSEPSPVSKLLMADEVLSPTTMLMPSKARKQARPGSQPQGMAAMGVAAAARGAGAGLCHTGNSQLQHRQMGQTHHVAGRPTPEGHSNQAASASQPQLQMQHLGLQQPLLLQPALLHEAQGQGQQHVSAAQTDHDHVPSAAQLQQAGHRPVVLACKLVLQQQADPASMQALFDAPLGRAANPLQGSHQGLPAPGSASAALVGSALQLAQQAGGSSTQHHLDQLKAVTESAVAAAATASAVAAATALLWQQLQQQEQARERKRQQRLLENQQGTQQEPVPAQEAPGQAPLLAEQTVDADAGAAAAADDAAAAADAVAEEPGSPASPAADAAEGTGSISRSSSSSTSAAGLSAAPGDSVDKQATAQTAGQQHPECAPRATPTSPAPPDAALAAGAGAIMPDGSGSASGSGHQPAENVAVDGRESPAAAVGIKQALDSTSPSRTEQAAGQASQPVGQAAATQVSGEA